MGSLNNGQVITQDTLTTKHTGHCIEVTDVVEDRRVDCHDLAKDGAGLNP